MLADIRRGLLKQLNSACTFSEIWFSFTFWSLISNITCHGDVACYSVKVRPQVPSLSHWFLLYSSVPRSQSGANYTLSSASQALTSVPPMYEGDDDVVKSVRGRNKVRVCLGFVGWCAASVWSNSWHKTQCVFCRSYGERRARTEPVCVCRVVMTWRRPGTATVFLCRPFHMWKHTHTWNGSRPNHSYHPRPNSSPVEVESMRVCCLPVDVCLSVTEGLQVRPWQQSWCHLRLTDDNKWAEVALFKFTTH